MELDFVAFKDWALLGLLSTSLYILWETKKSFGQSLDLLNQSVETLNIQIGVVIERTSSHEKRIDNLESKVNKQ